MFTGIIEEVGTVRRADEGTLVIECGTILEGTALGDSIAINGVDLTVAAIDGALLTFNCMPETYRLSRQPGTLADAGDAPLGAPRARRCRGDGNAAVADAGE